MNYETTKHIKSLLHKLSISKEDTDKVKKTKKDYRKAFEKMTNGLGVKGKSTKIRTYFGLLQLEEWWYLVFRTHKGRGAYLFLKLLKEGKIQFDEKIDDLSLWNLLVDCADWNEAEQVSDQETAEESDEGSETNESENKIGPGSGWGWP